MASEGVPQRLARIEGMVRGLARMVDDGAPCLELLTQVAAIRSAMHQVALLLVRDHARECVADAVRDDDQTRVRELLRAFERLGRA